MRHLPRIDWPVARAFYSSVRVRPRRPRQVILEGDEKCPNAAKLSQRDIDGCNKWIKLTDKERVECVVVELRSREKEGD